MGIEYLPGIEPGKKIDLEKFQKPASPESYAPVLKERLAAMARSINEKYKQDFLGADGRIVVRGKEADKDNEWALGMEVKWAKEKGLDLQAWREDKEKGSGTIAEMTMTVILNKLLNKDFIVARASDYDDYKNGVDHVLVDKNTGFVVCGFDEVVDDMQGYYSVVNKKEKMKNIAAKGGSEIKYGATIEKEQLVRSSFKNVPTFYVALSTPELGRLLEGIKNNPEEISLEEDKIFNKLILSLQEQANKLTANFGLNREAKMTVNNLIAAFESRKRNL